MTAIRAPAGSAHWPATPPLLRLTVRVVRKLLAVGAGRTTTSRIRYSGSVPLHATPDHLNNNSVAYARLRPASLTSSSASDSADETAADELASIGRNQAAVERIGSDCVHACCAHPATSAAAHAATASDNESAPDGRIGVMLKAFNDRLCMQCSSLQRRLQYEEVPDDNYDLPYHHQHNSQHQKLHQLNGGRNNNADNGETVMIKIDTATPLREEPRYPKEKWKTVLAFVLMSFNMCLVTVSLSIVHERVPDRTVYKPLPDIVLDNVTAIDWVLDVSEYLIMVQVNACILLILVHKHKFIVMRRIFLIMAILYFMRSITMFVTVLPVSNEKYYCSPKSPDGVTALLVVQRAVQLMSGFGLSINGKHTYCGDYIYSGHTVMLVLGYLTFAEYTPRRFRLAHWIAGLNAIVGVVMVMVAHGHYTIDVLIAYYVTTRLFWTYHTMANNNFVLKTSGPSNYLSREFWFVFFRYFECNVRGQVPNQYEWPLPWPRRFHTKIPTRVS